MGATETTLQKKDATRDTTSSTDGGSGGESGVHERLRRTSGLEAQEATLRPGDGGGSGPVQLKSDAEEKTTDSGGASSGGGKVNEAKKLYQPSQKAPSTFAEFKNEVASCGDWEAVKGKWLKDKAVMAKLCAFRQKFVDDLVKYVQRTAEANGTGRFEALALGSTALTSDYDITFSGSAAVFAVRTFNEKFRKEWGGKEAGTVFDTNVYAQNFLQDKKPGSADEEVIPVGGGSANVKTDQAYQDVMSLVKIRKNMSQSRWDGFVSRIVGKITDGTRKAEVQKRYDKANAIFKSTYVGELIGQMMSTTEGLQAVTALKKEGKSELDIVEKLAGAAPGLAASNRLYEEKLAAIEDLVKDRDALLLKQKQDKSPDVQKRIDAASVAIRAAHSDALLFANEPYFAAGTIRHVVGNMQAKYGLEVSDSEYLHSLNENFGDIVKEAHHQGGKSFPVMAIKTSKYAFRFLDACKQLGDKNKKVTIPSSVPSAHKAMKVVLDIRQGDGDWARKGDDEKAKAASDLLKGVGMTDHASFIKVLEDINVSINVSARAGGEAGSS